MRKSEKSLISCVNLDNGPNYGRSAKKEKTAKTIKLSLYFENLRILIKKNA